MPHRLDEDGDLRVRRLFPCGSQRATREIAELATQLPDFSVFVVEVCLVCKWNHLLTSYVLGTGEPLKRRARS
jgi:hypothetical protein